jgi:hypothetical protein
MKIEMTAERLKELLSYDPASGVFRWKVNRGGTAKADSVAGSVDANGYIAIQIDGETL